MNDKAIIIAGLVVFLAAVTLPVWLTPVAGGAGPRQLPELPAGETNCVEDKAYMTANHMQLLYEWRDAVVREGERLYASTSTGEQFEMSLTKTCLGCHTDREVFCNRCHDYADVRPVCWNCHVDPEGN
jgi:hypothetical protein